MKRIKTAIEDTAHTEMKIMQKKKEELSLPWILFLQINKDLLAGKATGDFCDST